MHILNDIRISISTVLFVFLDLYVVLVCLSDSMLYCSDPGERVATRRYVSDLGQDKDVRKLYV